MKKSIFANKAMALLLALIMVIPMGALPTILKSNAAPAAVTVDAAELVAENYDGLSAAEQDMLRSGLFEASVYQIAAPEDGSALITVDPQLKQVEIAPYPAGNYTWYPGAARIVGVEDIALDTTGKGSFTYDGASYAVEADYYVDIPVDATAQQTLINAPYYLTQGVEFIDAIVAMDYAYYLVAGSMPEFYKLTDGTYNRTLSSADTTAAIVSLYDQQVTNQGFLDIEMAFVGYDQAPSKVEYLFSNGANIRDLARTTYDQVMQIYNDAEVTYILNNVIGRTTSAGRKLQLALTTINDLLTNTADASTGPWQVLEPGGYTLKPVASMSAAEWTQLDALVAAASGNTALHTDAIKAELRTGPVSVSVNVNQYDVTVKLQAYVAGDVADSADLTALTEYTTTVRVPEGTSAADIVAAVEATGIEANSVTAWAVINTAYYDRTESALPQTITENIEYVIAYSPITIGLQYGFSTQLPTQVPYGYRLTFPANENTALVYDYQIEGVQYLQDEIYTVTHSVVVTRSEGKPWDVRKLGQIVAEVYAPDLSIPAQEVLQSVATVTDKVLLREPSNDDNLVRITALGGGTFKVEADDYRTGIPGVVWTAVSGIAIKDGVSVANFDFTRAASEEKGAAQFTVATFDQVEIVYRTVLTHISEQAVVHTLNLPAIFSEEVQHNLAAIEDLNTLYSKFEKLDQRTLNQIQVGVNGSEMGAEAKAAVASIISLCVDRSEAKLWIYEYLTEYADKGLAYYYQNAQAFQVQVALLHDNLKTIYEDPKFLPLLIDIGYEDYYQKIADIVTTLERVALDDPNEFIDTTSTALPALIESILACNTATNVPATYTQATRELALTKKLSKASPERVAANIKVVLKDSHGTELGSKSATITFLTGSVATDADINAILDKIAELAGELGFHAALYGADLTLPVSAGDTLSENFNVNITYAPIAFTGTFVDPFGTQLGTYSFYHDDPTITLPACTTANMQYLYTVAGTEITVGADAKTYTFTAAQIANGDYATILRVDVDEYSVAFNSLVDEINEGIADAGFVDGRELQIALIPIQDANGESVLVLRVSPKNTTGVKKAFQNGVEALTGSNFKYITLGGELIRDDSQISVQAIIDAVLQTGMNLDTILNAITPTGDLVEMPLMQGATIIGVDADGEIKYGNKAIRHLDLLGAYITEFDMELRMDQNTAGKNVKLYVTLEDFDKSASRLKTVRKAANKARQYGNITAASGSILLEGTLPERVFQAYMAAVSLYENAPLGELSNFEDADRALAIAKDVVNFLASDRTITMQTIENTLAKAGKHVDLSDYARFYSKGLKAAKNILNNSTITVNTTTAGRYDADIHYDIEALFNYVDLKDSLRGLIKETGIGLDLNVKAIMHNTADDYEAIILDSKMPRAGKLQYTKDLAAALPGIHDNTIIILLKDINANLTINSKAFIDLNGHVINGDLTANGKTRILDSSFATKSGAGVNGNLSGNLSISAGEYQNDVSAFLYDGYKQEDGLVRSEYYFILTGQSDNEVIVHIDKDPAASTNEAMKALALELAMDEAFHNYAGGALSIGNFEMYSFTVDNISSISSGGADIRAHLRSCLEKDNINALAADILAALGDYTDDAHAVQPYEQFTTYAVSYNPWTYTAFEHVTNGDYIRTGIAPDANETVMAGSIMVIAHEYVKDDAQSYEATCEAEGKNVYVCANADCKAVYEETLDPLGHDYQLTETVPATCTAAGYNRYTCSRCQDYYDEVIDILPHTPADSWEITIEATPDHDGEKVLKCSVCGTILDRQTIFYGHIDLQLIPSNRLASSSIDNDTRIINVVTKTDQPMAVFQLKLDGAPLDIYTWTDASFADGCQLKIKNTKYSAQTDAQGIRYFIIPVGSGTTQKLTVRYQDVTYEYTVYVTFTSTPVQRDGVVPGHNADPLQTGFEPGRDDLIYLVSLPGKTAATYRLRMPLASEGASVRVISADKPHIFQTYDRGVSYQEVQNDDIDDTWFVYFKSFKAEGINEYDLRITYADNTTHDIHVIVQWVD